MKSKQCPQLQWAKLMSAQLKKNSTTTKKTITVLDGLRRHSMYQHAVDICGKHVHIHLNDLFRVFKNLPCYFSLFFPHLKEGFAAHFAVEEVFPEGSRQNPFPRSATSSI